MTIGITQVQVRFYCVDKFTIRTEPYFRDAGDDPLTSFKGADPPSTSYQQSSGVYPLNHLKGRPLSIRLMLI